MRRRLTFVGLVVFVALVAVPTASAAPTQLARYGLSFPSASASFTFQIAKGDNPAGNLTADTIDCCLVGDHWKVSFDTARPANRANDVVGVGNGSTTVFSGAATAHPFIKGSVTVSFDSSLAPSFPAGMCVRFRYSKAPGVEITPPAGAILNDPGRCPPAA
jgi:hypothetical protein